MTCQHLNFKTISKSAGGSITASASYNQRQKMFDVVENCMKYPHTSASDHVLTKMLLPDGAPEEYSNTEKIWNDLNMIEKDRVGYKMTLAFQRELTFSQNMEVVNKFFNEEFVSKGHPVQISVHRGKNGNTHVHAITSDRRLVNGTWEKTKSETIYYKRGTVKEMDQRGKVINPDAVILTQNDKILQPILKNKKLQYDENGNIIFKKGWKELQYDADGKLLLNDKGEPVLMDIREPEYIPGTNIQQNNTKGKYLEPRWKQGNLSKSNIREIGNINRLRQSAERLFNEAFEKYNILDNNGQRLRISFASYRDQDKELADQLKRTATVHVGYYNEKNNQYANERLQYNEFALISNELVKDQKTLIAKKETLAQVQKALAVNKSTTKQHSSAQPKKQQKPAPAPKVPTPKSTSPAPTVRTNVAAAAAAKTLSALDDIAGKEVPVSSGKILRKDPPLTKEDWILREFLDDGTDAIDELPNHKPKTNAMRELQNALSTFQEYSHARSTEPAAQSAEPVTDNITISSTDDAQIHEAKMQAQAHAIAVRRIDDELEKEKKQKEDQAAAEKEYMAIKEPRIAAGNELRSQFIDFRLAVYSADRQKLDDLKTELDNEKQRLLNNRSSWQKLRNQKPKLSEEESKNLRHLQNQYSLTKIRFDKKYPELQKYPDIPEPQNKMRHHFAKIQISVVMDYAKKMGWTDPNQTIAKYEEIHAREKYLYCVVNTPKGQDDPASGQTETPVAKHESAPPTPEKNAEKIKNARLEAARKRREKEEKRKHDKRRPRT